jgi:two-component system response regulator HydG
MSEKTKILVVDDNEEFCQNVTDILELHDYEVISAYDGLKAMALVIQSDFSLVLMDIKMPVLDGLKTFRKIRQIAPNTPVIMVTAYAVEELVRDALREGAYGFLKKPIDFDDLLRLITQATGKGAMILVADNDRDLCANLKEVLSDRGYRVNVAYDGNMALEEATKNNFDVVLLDIVLPMLNGLETYLAIREFRPDVVAIVITGYRQEMSELVQQALQENVCTCLEKPIDIDKLLSLLVLIKEQKAKGTLMKTQ